MASAVCFISVMWSLLFDGWLFTQDSVRKIPHRTTVHASFPPRTLFVANLNLDAEGNVESVTDAGSIYEAYMMLCEAQGLGRPNVLT